MSDITKDQVVAFLSNMNVLELAGLVKELEETWGVSAAAAVAVAAGPVGDGGAAAAVEEQTEFDVVLEDFGAKKIEVIKVVRGATGLGLKEAKDLVESAPSTVKEAVSKDEAAALVKDLEAAGAKAVAK